MTVPRVAVVGMGGFAADHRSWARQLDAKGAVRQVAQVAPDFDRGPSPPTSPPCASAASPCTTA